MIRLEHSLSQPESGDTRSHLFLDLVSFFQSYFVSRNAVVVATVYNRIGVVAAVLLAYEPRGNLADIPTRLRAYARQ